MADLMILDSLPFIPSLPAPATSSVATHTHTHTQSPQSADGLSLVFMISSQAQLHIITVNSALSLKLKKIRLFVNGMYAAALLLGPIALAGARQVMCVFFFFVI